MRTHTLVQDKLIHQALQEIVKEVEDLKKKNSQLEKLVKELKQNK